MSSNSTSNANRLPFYKAPQPKPNLYQFEKKDIQNSPVVKRFEKRPAVVPQVTEGGRANQAGIKLGDSIVKINDAETREMSLSEAHQCIQEAGGDIKLTVKKLVNLFRISMNTIIKEKINFRLTNSFEEDETKINHEHEIELVKKNKKEIDRG